jgi:polar amino acid transport system substrate-binding protein
VQCNRQSNIRCQIGLISVIFFMSPGAEPNVASDPRVADLLQSGTLRAALFAGQFIKDPKTKKMRGDTDGIVSIALARALAKHLGIEFELHTYPSPLAVLRCLKANECDMAFLGFNPARAAELGLSPPYLATDFTVLVQKGSMIHSVADIDRAGVRIAVVHGHQSTLALERRVKNAELVAAETPDGAFDLLSTGRADGFASVRPALIGYSDRLEGSQVLDDRYGVNLLSMALAKERTGDLAYVTEFVENAKASGFVKQIVSRAGLRGMTVAPAGSPH